MSIPIQILSPNFLRVRIVRIVAPTIIPPIDVGISVSQVVQQGLVFCPMSVDIESVVDVSK